jgi:hypothetical protein
MMKDKAERREQIDRLISELAKSTSPEVEWMRELFEAQYEDAKERLVGARGDEAALIQGEAQYLQRFHRQLAAASALLKR